MPIPMVTRYAASNTSAREHDVSEAGWMKQCANVVGSQRMPMAAKIAIWATSLAVRVRKRRDTVVVSWAVNVSLIPSTQCSRIGVAAVCGS